MKKFVSTLLLTFAFVGMAMAAADDAKPSPPPPPPPALAEPKIAALTDAEKLSIRDAQVKLREVQDQAAQIQKLQQEALANLSSAIQRVYDARKIKQEEYALCDRPGTGGCATAPANDITLQPVPKPKADDKGNGAGSTTPKAKPAGTLPKF